MNQKILRIFISSPGDVAQERELARQVIDSLRRRYAGQFYLKPIFWEDLPLQPDLSFQTGIDMMLSEKGVDIAVFILWSRLGSPLGNAFVKKNGAPYLSGTEREFDLMLAARADSGGKKPSILFYTRKDEPSFDERLRGKTTAEKEELLNQKKLAETFLTERFRDAKTGVNSGAYHQYDKPMHFTKRLHTHLKELLDGMVQGDVLQAAWDIEKMGSPFMGLEAFQPQHAQVFFGRDQEIIEARHALREQAKNGCAFLLLSGASGSGKSSLARAGILPAIVENELDEHIHAWRRLIVTPSELGSDPSAALIRCMAAREVLPELRDSGLSLENLIEGVRINPEMACSLSLKAAFTQAAKTQGGGVRLLLVLDQLEELFTMPTVTPARRTEFLRALRYIAESGHVWILATARADFYHLIQLEPSLCHMKKGMGQMDVLPPAPDALRSLVEDPARMAGLRFEEKEGRSLSAAIINEASRHAELLPLLEYTLRELHERCSPGRLLTFEAYRSLGGVEGALAQRAEQVFLSLPADVQLALDKVLVSLVTIGDKTVTSGRAGEEESFIRLRAPMTAFNDSATRALVKAFVSERLFIADLHPQTGESSITVAHEALLRVWRRAELWAASNRDFLSVRARVASRLQDNGVLVEGEPLLDLAKLHLNRAGDGFTPPQRDFIQACLKGVEEQRARREKQRRKVILGLSALSGVAVLAALVAMVMFAVATRNSMRATKSEKLAKANEQLARESEERAKVSAAQALENEKQAKEALADSERLRKKNIQAVAIATQGKLGLSMAAGQGQRDNIAGILAAGDFENPENVQNVCRLLLETVRASIESSEWMLAKDNIQRARGLFGDNPLTTQVLAEHYAQVLLEEARIISNSGDPKAAEQTATAHLKTVHELSQKWQSSWRLPYVSLRLENIVVLAKGGSRVGYSALASRMLSLVELSNQDFEVLYWYYTILTNGLEKEFFNKGPDYDLLQSVIARYNVQFLNKRQFTSDQIERSLNLLERNVNFAKKQFDGENYTDTRQQRKTLLETLESTLRNTSVLCPKAPLLNNMYLKFLQMQLDSVKYQVNTLPPEKIREELTRQRAIASFLNVADQIKDGLARLVDSYTDKKTTAADKQAILIEARDVAETFRSLELDEANTAMVAVNVGKISELRKEAPTDPLVAIYDQMIDVYIQHFQAASVDKRISNYETFVNCLSEYVRHWLTNGQQTKVISFWESCLASVPLDQISRGDRNNLVSILNASAQAMIQARRQPEARQLITQTLTLCEAGMQKNPWDWYLNESYKSFCFELAPLVRSAGEDTLAQGLLRAGWNAVKVQYNDPIDFGKYATLPMRGDMPKDFPDEDRDFFQSFVKDQKGRINQSKMFVIPCEVNGAKVPVQFYIVTGKNGYQGMLHQFRWIQEYRGVLVPADVQDSLRKLHEIAVENNVNFLDLVTYALNYPAEGSEKKK